MGGKIENVMIYSPDECLTKLDYQYVIISSTFGLDSIKKQCMDHGITEDRLIILYIEAPVESRRIFLQNFAECCINFDKDAQCAEAGVFMGNFAKYINYYFPETTAGIMGKFLFVNLDMDLYRPTYAGLQFFGSKMVHGGVILIHDYFADEFKKPKAAVDEYITRMKTISKVLIGDGCSILLVGF